jgi:hypothetical protein
LFNRKSLKWIIGGIVCCLVFSIVWATRRLETEHLPKPPPHIKSNLSAVGPSMAIRGFTFNGYDEGRRTLSIMADPFIVDKKKIGFFRCGLMNTAKLNNAVIDIYASEAAASHSDPHKNSLNGTMQRIVRRIDFPDLLIPDNLKSITKKRITAIEMSPVTIRVHDKKRVISTVCSKYAKISLKNQAITFDTNVRVTADSRTLTTKHLAFIPKRSVFRTSYPFVLKTDKRELKGNYLEIDCCLDHVFTTHRNAAHHGKVVKKTRT